MKTLYLKNESNRDFRNSAGSKTSSISGKSVLPPPLQLFANSDTSIDPPPIQRSIDTNGGTWDTDSYTTVDDGAEITLDFNPNDQVNATKIGLIQKSLKIERGKNYDIKARADYESGAWMADAQKRKAQRSDGESHIDRDVRMNNPIYGAPNLKPGEAISKTPKGALDMSDTAQKDGTAQNYQLGWNYKTFFGGKKSRSAKLYDKPNLPGATSALEIEPGATSRMIFETTAVCLSGKQKGMYYGSVQWGFEINDKDIGPELKPLSKLSDGVPSDKMIQVMENWNAGEFSDGVSNLQIPIPDQD